MIIIIFKKAQTHKKKNPKTVNGQMYVALKWLETAIPLIDQQMMPKSKKTLSICFHDWLIETVKG